MSGPRSRAESIERLLSYTKPNGECLEYTGATDKKGYARIYWRSRNQIGSRVAYTLAKHEIDEGMVIMHTCDNPPCINPEHLKQGTQYDNSMDSVSKGRHVNMKGENNTMAKLTEYQVKTIHSLFAAGVSANKLSKTFNVSRRTVAKIINGESWEHLKLEKLETVKRVSESGSADSEVGGDELDGVGVERAEE